MTTGTENGAEGARDTVTPKDWLKQEMALGLGPFGAEDHTVDDTAGGRGRGNPPKTRKATRT